MFASSALIALIFSWGVGLALLYFVIRLAVRHAIRDADERRATERPRNF